MRLEAEGGGGDTEQKPKEFQKDGIAFVKD